MAYRDTVLPRVVLAGLTAMVVAVASCTATPEPTTTTQTDLPITTKPTEASPCPDVFCVVLTVDPEAMWSDGRPVTAADLAHTLELARSGEAGHPGYDLVTGHEILDEGTLLVTFGGVFGSFSSLLESVLPVHDASVVSGTHSLETEDGSVRLVRRGDAPGVVVVEVVGPDGVRGVVQGLRRGEVDVAWLPDPPAWAVEELRALEGLTVDIGPGPDWEMITFNQANPLLAESWLRGAIVNGIDREAVLDVTVRTVDPEARALDSTMWMHGMGLAAAPYPHVFDPDRARSGLDAHGCNAGDDGILVCDGTRLSFVWATTAGDLWRETQLDMAVESLASIGIEIVPRLLVPADLFSEDHLFGDEWDIVSFAWTAQPDPYLSADLYRCHGDGPHGFGALNIGRHCGPGVDENIAAAVRSLDPAERTGNYHKVDLMFLEAAAIVPLYQRPVVTVHRVDVGGPVTGPFAGPFHDLARWSGPERVVLAVLTTPASAAVIGPLDPVTHSLRLALYRGAFRRGADGGYASDLVVGFDILLGR